MMLATTDRRDRREHSNRRTAESYRKFRVYYRLEDDVILPTPNDIVAFAKTQDEAAQAVADEIDGAVPIYVEEFKLAKRVSYKEILEIHGYDTNWGDN
jgi:hypothetical protein